MQGNQKETQRCFFNKILPFFSFQDEKIFCFAIFFLFVTFRSFFHMREILLYEIYYCFQLFKRNKLRPVHILHQTK